MSMTQNIFNSFMPEIFLIAGLVALIALSFIKKANGSCSSTCLSGGVSAGSLLLALGALFCSKAKAGIYFDGAWAHDGFSIFFKALVALTALMTVLLTAQSRDIKNKVPQFEFNAFLLTLTLGLFSMSSANDMLMIYLAIEMASIVSYVLTGYLTNDLRSEESGLKYVLYGGVASGIMIFGMSLLYGLTGSLNLTEIREFLHQNPTDRLVLFLTFIFILAGLGYKMAVAPFHMWSPDVYEGAPLPVTAFLSVASKAAGFAVTLRFFVVGFLDATQTDWVVLKSLDWQFLIAVMSAITMTVGNLVAMQQTNVKRFLAYSSVAHAGYLLMGIASQSQAGIEAVQFYMLVYLLMNMGGFFIVSLIANQFQTEEMSAYKGLASKGGYGFILAVGFAIFLFSLAGIPPFAGFIGKWYLFKAAVGAKLVWLTAVAAINSVISLFYYLRFAKFMLIDTAEGQALSPVKTCSFDIVISVCAGLTIILGLYFAPVTLLIKNLSTIVMG